MGNIRPVVFAILAVTYVAPASAQQLGDPIDTHAFVVPGGLAALISDASCIPAAGSPAEQLGGATLLASATPGGPLLASLPLRPVPPANSDERWCPGISIPGPPPGNYWVLLVYGLTTTATASPSDWKPLVIPARCTGRPLPPVLASGMPQIVGNSVTLGFTGSAFGCSINRIDLEVGTTPGGREIGVFPLQGFDSFFPGVPAGTYYARARGVNASGSSQPSVEIPIRIPNQCTNQRPQGPLNPTVSVNGNTVTISWTQTVGGTTFYQVAIMDPSSMAVLDHVILPPQTQIVANVPSGNYRVRIIGGNACGMTPMVPLSYLDFTVP